jgi:signal transduction histidine kinase
MEEIETLKIENEKLKKINAAKSELISVSAHQLRTSLSALKWILKMFLNKDLGKISTEQEGFMVKAYDSNERMITLVNNLLTLNHTGEVSNELKFGKVDIIKLIEQILFEFSGETFNKGIELTLLKPDTSEIHTINCDVDKIRVVLQNLIENAIKYSYAHGKIVVTVRNKKDTNLIEISVHDNGIGISKENQQNIFNKFFRATEAIKKEATGSGLGLYTTREIVEQKVTLNLELRSPFHCLLFNKHVIIKL